LDLPGAQIFAFGCQRFDGCQGRSYIVRCKLLSLVHDGSATPQRNAKRRTAPCGSHVRRRRKRTRRMRRKSSRRVRRNAAKTTHHAAKIKTIDFCIGCRNMPNIIMPDAARTLPASSTCLITTMPRAAAQRRAGFGVNAALRCFYIADMRQR